jgi:hypothetical protein
MASAASRAYGKKHRAIRKRLLAMLAATGPWPCPRCGKPMIAGMRLHLGHSFEAAKLLGLPGDRLEHASCNEGAGGRIGITYAHAARAARTADAVSSARRKPSLKSRDW